MLILSPTLKYWGSPSRQGLCHQFAHLWATADFIPRSEPLGTPPSSTGKCYVANLPICGPLLILFPALKRWGPPSRQVLCSQMAHLWAIVEFVPRSKTLGTHVWSGVMSQICPFVGHC